MKYRAAHRVVLLGLAASSVALIAGGCGSDPAQADGVHGGVVTPIKTTGGTPATRSMSSGNPQTSGRVIASVEGVSVPESQLVELLYASSGLDELLKLVQLDMARAEAARKGLTVTPADVAEERKLTMALAFPGQDEADYENLLRQLLAQQHVTKADFDVVMETNACLRACVRGQANSDISADAIQNEFNQVYGERVRVRDIPVNNMQEVSEVRRLLGEPGARFEDVARRMGKVPALAQLGGQLPEFSRTSTGYSPVFTQAAFALQPGQVSTDAIEDQGFFHILQVEDRIPPRAVKFEDVKESVRESLIARRANNLMGAMRRDFAQRALRELKISEPTMKQQFADRLAAENPKPSDKQEVQRSLEQAAPTTTQATTPTVTPATAPAATLPAMPTPSR